MLSRISEILDVLSAPYSADDSQARELLLLSIDLISDISVAFLFLSLARLCLFIPLASLIHISACATTSSLSFILLYENMSFSFYST